MTQGETAAERSVSSEVQVPTDPETAFTAFTEELDLWWVRGPINHWAGGRMAAMHCEPGIGGRLLEMYDKDSGDALELGRITVWEPGRRLAWQSSVDDVKTEVIFEAVGSSTNVRVTARVPAGGVDRGGTAWTRVVPKWFGKWCERRDTAAHRVQDLSRLALGMYYEKPAAAARWLADVFDLQSPDPLPQESDPLPETEHGHPWIEFRIGTASLMIFKLDPGRHGESTHIPWVYVDHIEDHFHHTESCGATIVTRLGAPWGLPIYTVEDLEGNRWTFAQARPTM
jgi:uncharacterized glyoxalase superfamily protein PhnB